MSIRADGKSRPAGELAERISFAPHAPETAWDQLDRLTTAPQGAAREIGSEMLVKLAEIVIEARQSRAHSLPSAIFG